MDVRTYGRTENLPILQDFVPYRGRCPATAQFQPKNCIKQGKGTADHMMPLGDWFVSGLNIPYLYSPRGLPQAQKKQPKYTQTNQICLCP